MQDQRASNTCAWTSAEVLTAQTLVTGEIGNKNVVIILRKVLSGELFSKSRSIIIHRRVRVMILEGVISSIVFRTSSTLALSSGGCFTSVLISAQRPRLSRKKAPFETTPRTLDVKMPARLISEWCLVILSRRRLVPSRSLLWISGRWRCFVESSVEHELCTKLQGDCFSASCGHADVTFSGIIAPVVHAPGGTPKIPLDVFCGSARPCELTVRNVPTPRVVRSP